jgi:hypothetical protein
MASTKSELRLSFSGSSEADETDFPHQGFEQKCVTIGELAKISTSAQALLLLLVL